MPPVGYVVIANFFLPLGAFHDGEYEVYVRMHQFIPFHTRRTRAAGIGLRAVRAADVTGISHSQRKFAYSCRSAEQLRVRNTSFPHLLYQLLFGCILAYYIFKNTVSVFG